VLRQSTANSSMSSLPTRFDSSSSSLPLCESSSHGYLYSGVSTVPIPRKWLYLAIVVFLLPWGLYSRTTSQFMSLTEDVIRFQDSQNIMSDQITMKRQLMVAFASDMEQLKVSNDSLSSDLQKIVVQAVDTTAGNYEKLEKKEGAMIKCIDDLESHVQENSRLAIEQDYGTGPYQVELTLRSKIHMRVELQTIVIQLAPLNLMPHAVHHFLRMLKERLWEGMAMMPQQSAPHRLQASPVDMETLETMDWRFENAKLKNLVFAEHSPDYRCNSYSLGFSGNPGGPDFYINGLAIPDKGASDSCFGKVVKGRDIIDSIIAKQESPVLGIERLRLLPRKKIAKAKSS